MQKIEMTLLEKEIKRVNNLFNILKKKKIKKFIGEFKFRNYEKIIFRKFKIFE